MIRNPRVWHASDPAAVIRGRPWSLSTDGLIVKQGDDALSRYDAVSFSAGARRKLDNVVMSPRPFATKSHPAQLKVFALDEAPGEGASLKALALEGPAARS